ncbi:MAG: hypothetical protein V7607_2580 [Solirubrobacteraceae bacterium]
MARRLVLDFLLDRLSRPAHAQQPVCGDEGRCDEADEREHGRDCPSLRTSSSERADEGDAHGEPDLTHLVARHPHKLYNVLYNCKTIRLALHARDA